MGFLKQFFRNVFHDEGQQLQESSFERLTEEELEAHLGVKRYGDFVLTDAIRPSYDLQIVPRQGYRHDVYHDAASKTSVPVLMAAASDEHLFDIFIDMLDPLGPVVDVVLETSHDQEAQGHTDLYREHIDLPVLKSTLMEFEDLLTNDGCVGIAILNPNAPQEVQFDEHKLLIAYGADLSEYEAVLEERDIRCNDEIKFVTEAEHVHSTSERFAREFEQLKMRLGMEGTYY